MTRSLLAAALLAALPLPALGSSLADCDGAQAFDCIAETAQARMAALGIEPNEDQRKALKAFGTFAAMRDRGAAAAVTAIEEQEVPAYDLALALLLARKDEDAREVVTSVGMTGIYDDEGKDMPGGEAALERVKEDVSLYYLGVDDPLVWVEACEDEAAFATKVGAMALFDGACRAPFEPRAVSRTYALLRLKGEGAARDVIAAGLRHAFRGPHCTLASTLVDLPRSQAGLADAAEDAAWVILDAATVCAAEQLVGESL